jgi:hypothetical protein
MAKYQAWIVVQKRDEEIESVLLNIGNPLVNLDPRPRISLLRKGDTVEFCVAEPKPIFDQIPKEGDFLRAITSAPYEDVKFFHKKILQVGASRYRILCDYQLKTHKESPYARRFLSICNETVAIAGSLDPWQPIIAVNPDKPNLWLEPESVELTEEQVKYCFGRGAAADELTESFLLPPIRVMEDFPAQESYFNESLIDLRRALYKLLGSTDVKRVAESSSTSDQIQKDSELECPPNPLCDPTICTMVRLCDEPLLRDVFMDGGVLALVGDEGAPTRIILHLALSGPGAEEFRSRFILDPDKVVGPEWARDIARAVNADIRGMLPDSGLEISTASECGKWDLQPFPIETDHTGGTEGSWTAIYDLSEKLLVSSSERKTLWESVLNCTQGKPERPNPDHGSAERLFIDRAWRCPWNYDLTEQLSVPRFDPWIESLRELLLKDFCERSLSAEERVDEWSKEMKMILHHHRAPFKGLDNIFFLSYSGQYEPDLVMKWRLLLPWLSIIRARTIILNDNRRSQLNKGFALA